MGFSPPDATGRALTIVSICVTLIVGVSVVDSLTVLNLQKQIEKLAEKQLELQEIKNTHDKRIEEQENLFYISNQLSWGLAIINWQPFSSFCYLVKGLEKSLEINHLKGIHSCLTCMENVPKIINTGKEDFNDAARKKGIPKISDEIKSLDSYKLIKSEVDKIFNEMEEYYKCPTTTSN